MREHNSDLIHFSSQLVDMKMLHINAKCNQQTSILNSGPGKLIVCLRFSHFEKLFSGHILPLSIALAHLTHSNTLFEVCLSDGE